MSDGPQPDRRTGNATNGKPYESVWDYPRPPRLEQIGFLIEVQHGGETIARSDECYRVLETSQPPAFYIPPGDVDGRLLKASANSSFCEWKGLAAYADVVVEGAGPATNGLMPPVPPQQAVHGGGGGGKANPNSRTSSTTMSQMTGSTFSQLPLSAPTQRAIAEVLRYQTLTKVQNDSIPPALAGEFTRVFRCRRRLSVLL